MISLPCRAGIVRKLGVPVLLLVVLVTTADAQLLSEVQGRHIHREGPEEPLRLDRLQADSVQA